MSLALVTGGVLVAPAPASADTVRGLQWYLDSLQIPQAHKITKGRGVTVAVVDTGVDASHPALAGRVLGGAGFGIAAGSDGRKDVDTKSGHGTGMAGLVAGVGGSDMVQLGIAPEAEILPVAVASGSTGAPPRVLVEAVRWAVDNGADVINLSLRIAGSSPELAEAIAYAISRDVVVVAAAGNTEQADVGIGQPANIPGVIAVTGTGRNGKFHSGSTFGPEAVLAGPIEDIIAPVPFGVSHNGYGVGTGTSSTTAIVSGIAALVRAKYPDLDAANVVNRLIGTASDLGPEGRDDRYGFGAVDPVAALTASVPSVQQHPLVAADGGGSGPDGAGPEKSDDGEPWLTVGVTNKTGAVIQVALCLLIPVALVVVLVLVLRRGSRRKAAAAPNPPGFGNPGQPGGPPPPPGPFNGGYGSPPGHPMWQPPAGPPQPPAGPPQPPTGPPHPGYRLPTPPPPAEGGPGEHRPPTGGSGR
ncbi:S8 family serine peptidase [Melissospora conviva]|uniref:S8 family serine peptidase n=1 Tax=Melissospora conviva TaxID=3388432 RepID=UPI003C14725F